MVFLFYFVYVFGLVYQSWQVLKSPTEILVLLIFYISNILNVPNKLT